MHVDITRAHEIANEARRVKKQLKDCQHLAMLYNNRERIFGLPITNVSPSLGLQEVLGMWAAMAESRAFCHLKGSSEQIAKREGNKSLSCRANGKQ